MPHLRASNTILQTVILTLAILVACAAAFAEGTASSVASLRAVQGIVNVHEHVADERGAEQLLRVMDSAGIGKTVLLGTSRFSFALREWVGFTNYDENNEFILRLAQEHPDRLEAWPTLDPLDPDKLEKLADLVDRGATGLKLYTGHGYIRRDTGGYMFHPIAMDDPRMFPVYAYCTERQLPVLIHVNPDRPGFADEFVSMLNRYPTMKVISPHFILSTRRLSRLAELFDVFPNLYCDISLGHDDFLKEGLQTISRNPDPFQRLLDRYPDRFFFGLDLVYKAYSGHDDAWYLERIETYYRLLSQDTYTTALLPGVTLRGLGLRESNVVNLLTSNFQRFRATTPVADAPVRAVNWRAMQVWRGNRAPGEALPAPPRERYRWR